MSQLTNTINTVFRARDGGLVAQLGGYAQGFGTIYNRLQDNSRMSDRLSAQWRAFGTTIRYAIAGQAVFGLTNLLSQLKDVQQQMGLIAAIGSQPGGLPFTQTQLNTQLQQNMKGAVDAITPLNEYNDAVINFLSTVQNVPQDQITPMVTVISQAAKLAQISAEDATKAFTTMNVAFGQKTNLENVRRMAQEFFILTQQAPGGRAAGQQIIGQLGQLAAVTRIAGGRPEDIFSLLLSSLRGGIPPSQAGRGLQFLIQTLALPGQQTTASKRALAQVGITPTADLTLQQRLTRVFQRARQMGVHGNLQRLTNIDDETLSDLEAQPTTAALGSLGITGPGAAYLGTVFRRIHALRTAVAILGQVDTGQAQKDLALINNAAQGHVSDVNDLAKAWDRFDKQAQLQKAVVALNTMGVQVATAFAPIFNFIASHGIVPGTKFLQGHPDETKLGVYAGTGAIGAGLLARLFGFRISGAGRLLRGAGRFGMGAEAVESAISHPGVLGGSPLNPLYVIVVGQLFGQGGILSKFGRGAAGTAAKDAEAAAEQAATKGGIFSRIGNFVKTAVGGVAVGGARYGLRGIRALPGLGLDIAKSPLTYRMGGAGVLTALEALANPEDAGKSYEIYNYLARTYGGQNIEGVRYGMLHGVATVWVTLDTTTPGGQKKRKTFHIPVSMAYQGGKTPSTAGKPRTNRSNRG